MRRGSIFWGLVLVLLGGLFLLQALGLIREVLGWFWPLLFILLGVWVLTERFLPGVAGNGETFSVDLQGATRIDLDFDHGAGSVILSGGAPAGVALVGSQASGMDIKSHLSGEALTVELNAGPTFLPFLGPEGGDWRFQLSQEVPVNLKVDAGASRLDFDFTNVKLAFLGVDTGASSLKVKLPAEAGKTLVDIESGAATIELFVPQGVAARIRMEQGASSIKIDETRFPRSTSLDQFYQSPDFETAVNRVEISLEGGANSVWVG